MKKFILGLFLILGAVSFAAPKFVDMTKVKNAGMVAIALIWVFMIVFYRLPGIIADLGK